MPLYRKRRVKSASSRFLAPPLGDGCTTLVSAIWVITRGHILMAMIQSKILRYGSALLHNSGIVFKVDQTLILKAGGFMRGATTTFRRKDRAVTAESSLTRMLSTPVNLETRFGSRRRLPELERKSLLEFFFPEDALSLESMHALGFSSRPRIRRSFYSATTNLFFTSILATQRRGGGQIRWHRYQNPRVQD